MNRSRKPFIRHFYESIHIRSRGYLPHWEAAEGGIYLVTFRLADALPRTVIEKLAGERQLLVRKFEKERKRSLSWIDRLVVNRLFAARVDHYLDAGSGSCVLRDERAATIVVTALRFFDAKRYQLTSWCVMPNHVHLIVRPFAGWSLSSILHSWKSYTSKEIRRALDLEGSQVWQEEYFDHLLRGEEELREMNAYVLRNPESAGLVNWPWVSARVDEWK
jgi:REP element-mobilizing transposase RayT